MNQSVTQTIETLRVLREQIEARIPEVRSEHQTLAQATRLMRRHNAPSITDAIREEARQRVLRDRYAQNEGRM